MALGLNLVRIRGVGVEAGVIVSYGGVAEPWIDGGVVGMMSSSISHLGDAPRETESLMSS